MPTKKIYEYTNYKIYLTEFLRDADPAIKRSGARTRLAQALGCQPAFISRVLNTDSSHLSQEHGMLTNRFLGHDEAQSHFFMLLLNHAKAGSVDVAHYYAKQIQEIRDRRIVIGERIQVKDKLSAKDQARYYSSWHYTAIHTLLMIPDFQSVAKIAERLNLSQKLVTDILEFLTSTGAVERQGARFISTRKRTHLGTDSPMLMKHHTNWRMKAIQSLDDPKAGDFHFSGPVCLGFEDLAKIRSILLKSVESSEEILRQAKDETLFALAMDFFSL